MPRSIRILILLLFAPAACTQPPPPAPPRDMPVPAPPPAAPAHLDLSLRVAVLQEADSCVIQCSGGCDIVDPRSEEVLASIDHEKPLEIRFGGGLIRMALLQRVFELDRLELRPRGGGTVSVRDDRQMRPYRGFLRLVRRSPSTAAVLNVVDIEEYLLGVVPAEMSADFPPAALRAQAIAARTFAWHKKLNYGAGHDWDVNDDQSSQVYRGAGLDPESEPARAVRQTRGIVCTWDSPSGERIFPTHYSSTCGGLTRPAPKRRGAPDYSVLAGDVECAYCARSQFYRWPAVAISRRAVTRQLAMDYPRIAAIGLINRIEVTRRSPRGRPVMLTVYDSAGRGVSLDVEDFRLKVDPTGRRLLKSGFFRPSVRGDSIVFADGRGWGHGYGMCQYGAGGLAREGHSAEEILKHYYPGCHVARAY